MTDRTRRFRPIDGIWSLKLKLGVLLGAAIALSIALTAYSFYQGWSTRVAMMLSFLASLTLVHFLASGMTHPLKEMAEAASKMSSGDYSRRVRATSADEVGDLARAFNQMANDLSHLEEQRKAFVANAAHELRTPLTALSVNLENIIDGVVEPEQPILQAMAAQTQRLSRLVESLLDLSTLESGNAKLECKAFSVGDLLARIQSETTLHSPGLVVTVLVADDLKLLADEERVHQVLFNLVENASRFSPEGAPVTLSARAENDGVCIQVADSGPGIPEADRSKIFERFHRVDANRSRPGGGSGLGLSISRWVVDLHGGSIHVEPNEPVGARFVVQLPNARAG